jgi:hypothetical protein
MKPRQNPMQMASLLIVLLLAGCEDSIHSDSHLRSGTSGTPSQVAAENQTGDSSQVNVNRVGTMPQDGENAAVGGSNGDGVRPGRP